MTAADSGHAVMQVRQAGHKDLIARQTVGIAAKSIKLKTIVIDLINLSILVMRVSVWERRRSKRSGRRATLAAASLAEAVGCR